MSQETQQIESKLPIKVIIVGDGAVGKTCLAETFVKKKFPEEYVPTVFQNFAETITVDDEVKTSRYALCALCVKLYYIKVPTVILYPLSRQILDMDYEKIVKVCLHSGQAVKIPLKFGEFFLVQNSKQQI